MPPLLIELIAARVNFVASGYRAMKQKGGVTVNVTQLIPASMLRTHLEEFCPPEQNPWMYSTTHYSPGVTYAERVVEVATLYQEVYRKEPSSAVANDVVLSGHRGARVRASAKFFHIGAVAKLVVMALFGYTARQSSTEVPDTLADLLFSNVAFFEQVVVPTVAYFEVLFDHRGVLEGKKILFQNVGFWERRLKDNVTAYGVWSNSWKDARQCLSQDDVNANRGVMLPYALFASKLVPGFIREFRQAVMGSSPTFYFGHGETFTRDDMASLTGQVLYEAPVERL